MMGLVGRWCDRRVPLPAFDSKDLVAIGLVLSASAFLFGLAVVQDDAAVALYDLVARGWWVAAFWVGAAALATGFIVKWHHAVWLGNGLLGTAYVSMLVGLLIVAHDRVVIYLALFLPFSLIHSLAWMRLGYRVPPAHTVNVGPQEDV